MPPDTEGFAAFLGGFIAAEGTFVITGSPPRFRFAIALGAKDRGMCERAFALLMCGSLHDSPRRKPHYDDECAFAVQSLVDHVEVTIPFMDEHLPVSYKRDQYLAWKAQLLDYWEHKARRVRPCTIEGCERPRRARALCRHHLFAVHGASRDRAGYRIRRT